MATFGNTLRAWRKVRSQSAVRQDSGSRAVLEIQETWQGNGIAEGSESKSRSISLMAHPKLEKCDGRNEIPTSFKPCIGAKS